MKLVVLRLIGLSLLVKSESWEDWNRHMVSMMDKHAVLKHLCNERACSKCIDVFETEYVQSSHVYTLCFRILAKDSCQGSKSLICIVSIDQSQKYDYHITHCYTVIGQFKYYEPTIFNPDLCCTNLHDDTSYHPGLHSFEFGASHCLLC